MQRMILCSVTLGLTLTLLLLTSAPALAADQTDAYRLQFDDHCNGTVTVTVTNRSTGPAWFVIEGHAPIRAGQNDTVALTVTPGDGIVEVSADFGKGPHESAMHEWTQPARCATAAPAPAALKSSPTPAPKPRTAAHTGLHDDSDNQTIGVSKPTQLSASDTYGETVAVALFGLTALGFLWAGRRRASSRNRSLNKRT